MPSKILITIPQFTLEARTILAAVGEVTDAVPAQVDLAGSLEPYDVVVVGLGLRFDRPVLERATRLRLLATATTGLDHVDLAVAEERGIAVVSLLGETEFLRTITGTAELAFGLLLALVRQIPHAFDSVRRHEWQRERFRGHELTGKVLGVVGLGRLGSMVARYGAAFEMEVIAHDPHVDRSVFDAVHARAVDAARVWAESDVISLHVPLSQETTRMVDATVLARMKPTAVLINTARGGIVDEGALLVALQRGQLAGYAADVLADEVAFGGTFATHPLVEYAREHANVVLTPHIGGMTHESRHATDRFIAEKVVRWVQEHASAYV